MAVQPLASQVGVAPACRGWGCQEARSRASAAPFRPPGPCARPMRARPRRARQPALRRPSHRPRLRRCSMKAGICAPSARCPRAAQSAQSLHQARAGGHGAQPDLDNIPGAQTLDVLLPLCLARHLQPLRRGLDGCRSGCRDADRGNRAPGAHPAFGPRRADDQQVHRPTLADLGVTRSLSRPQVMRRQPLLRGAVQDPEVSPRLPWPLRRHYRRHRLLPVVLPLVQHRAPPCRDRDAHPR